MTLLLTRSGDLLDAKGVSWCYLTIEPFQSGVDHLQVAVAVYVTHCVPYLHRDWVQYPYLQDIFAGDRHTRGGRNALCLLPIPPCIQNFDLGGERFHS